jgi:MFS family permease
VRGQDSKQTSRRALVVGLMLCVVAVAFEAIAVVTAMPAAADDLGDLGLYAWAFTAFMIAQVFAIVAAGQMSDARGPKRPMVIGFALFAVGLVISGSAPTMPILMVGRFVQGLGGGAMNLAVMVLIARLFDAKERAVLMTAMAFAWMAPAFVGPPIAAWLTNAFSWHWVFFSVLPVMAAGGLLILGPLLRTELQPLENAVGGIPKLSPALLVSAGWVASGAACLQVAGQLLGASDGNHLPADPRLGWWVLLWVLAAAVLLRFGLPPLLPSNYRLGGGGLAANINVRMLAAGSFFGSETFLTLVLVRSEGLDLTSAGLTLTVGSVGWALGSWAQSRAWLGLRRDQIIIVGTAICATGLAAVTAAAWLPGHGLIWLLILGWTVGGLGMGLQMASTSLVVMELSTESELGRNTSSLQVAEALGNAVVAGLAGTIFAALLDDSGLAFGTLFTAMTTVSLLSLMFSLRIGPVANHSLDNISTSR